ncbi:hypothetical protein OIU84_008199 [Salix udensis]|uniref:Uncharacterized protein n=1 Tax=Salix udensis TaxID=889485 RepID=A0AAD6JUI5_9ROSI|nr:hypothetical protein OIU84_008199 [Salix udensis]
MTQLIRKLAMQLCVESRKVLKRKLYNSPKENATTKIPFMNQNVALILQCCLHIGNEYKKQLHPVFNLKLSNFVGQNKKKKATCTTPDAQRLHCDIVEYGFHYKYILNDTGIYTSSL